VLVLLPYAPWLAWVCPLIGAACTIALPRTRRALSNVIAVASIGLSAVFAFSLVPEVLAGVAFDWRVAWYAVEVSVLVDPLNVVMACVVSLIGLLVTLFSVAYMADEPELTRFWFLIQLFIGGYLTIVLSGHLLLTFIGWELVGLTCMALASFWYRDPAKAATGLKTGLILRVGDLALLAAVLSIGVHAGSLHLRDLEANGGWAVALAEAGALEVTLLLFLLGAVVKAAQFPLQEWLPDMLAASPSCFNALTECLAGPFLVARLLPAFHTAWVAGADGVAVYFLATAWIGVITALLTALLATARRNVFRALAYSVSSVIGYMLTALGLAGLSADYAPGYLAGTFLLTVDAFVTGLLFLTAALVAYAVRSDALQDMAGYPSSLAHRGLEVGVFATIGVPPLSGFWIANWIQTVALGLAAASSQPLLAASGYLIFGLLIVTGGITAFYGLRMLWVLLGRHEPRTDSPAPLRAIPRLMRAALAVMVLVTMLIDFLVPLLIPEFNRFFAAIVPTPFLGDVFAVGWYILPSISTVLSIVALTLGALPAYRIYRSGRLDAARLLRRSVVLRTGHRVLAHRLYLNAAYRRLTRAAVAVATGGLGPVERALNWVVVEVGRRVLAVATGGLGPVERALNWVGIALLQIKGFNQIFDLATQYVISIAEWLYPRVELAGLEAAYRAIPTAFTRVADRLRDLQTGVLSYNMLGLLLGVILLALSLLFFGGALGGLF
jgi:NADH-quinone oxidoreductase subunit L